MAAPRKPTFTPEQLQAYIDQALAVQRAEFEKSIAAKPATPVKPDQSNKNLLKTIAVFKKAGYGVVVPHQDVKTFNLWVKEGLRPKEGEKSKPVNNLRLFHRSQCRPLTKAEGAEFVAKAKEAEAKRQATVVPMGPSASKLPVVELVPQAAPKARKATAVPTDQPSA